MTKSIFALFDRLASRKEPEEAATGDPPGGTQSKEKDAAGERVKVISATRPFFFLSLSSSIIPFFSLLFWELVYTAHCAQNQRLIADRLPD